MALDKLATASEKFISDCVENCVQPHPADQLRMEKLKELQGKPSEEPKKKARKSKKRQNEEGNAETNQNVNEEAENAVQADENLQSIQNETEDVQATNGIEEIVSQPSSQRRRRHHRREQKEE